MPSQRLDNFEFSYLTIGLKLVDDIPSRDAGIDVTGLMSSCFYAAAEEPVVKHLCKMHMHCVRVL